MKSCPKCNRTFPDEGQKFCTFDGGLLIAPQTFDPNATIRATSIDLNAASERPTSRDLPDPNATIIENYPATVALPRATGPTTGPTSTPSTADLAPPPPPAPAVQPPAAAPPPPPPPPPPPVETAPPPAAEVPAPVAQAPSAPLPPAAAQKKSKTPWIIAGILLFLLLGGGVLAGAFFLFVKPRLDEMRAQQQQGLEQPNDNRDISTPTPVASVETPTPAPEETYTPPAGTVQFVNSNEKLDGKLAEHYLDFSFYFPESWRRDPKAGVKGASNFVKVDKALAGDFTQEEFAVGWYTSTGTFVGDLSNYPARVKELSDTFAKRIPEYRLVSEGNTKVNSMDAYEFRWEGASEDPTHGNIKLWGRVVFLPTGNQGDSAGATLIMFCTSLAPDLSSIEDVGVRGEMPVILESFRFGKKQ